MPITDDYIIFADKYHNRQHLPDDIIKNIMDINTNIFKEKQYKKAHKQKFNIVVRHLYDCSYDAEDLDDLFTEKDTIMTSEYKGIFRADDACKFVYTKDLILVYDTPDDCINDIDGFNEWQLQLNTAGGIDGDMGLYQ